MTFCLLHCVPNYIVRRAFIVIVPCTGIYCYLMPDDDDHHLRIHTLTLILLLLYSICCSICYCIGINVFVLDIIALPIVDVCHGRYYPFAGIVCVCPLLLMMCVTLLFYPQLYYVPLVSDDVILVSIT